MMISILIVHDYPFLSLVSNDVIDISMGNYWLTFMDMWGS